MYLTHAFVVLGTPEVTYTTSIESPKQKIEKKNLKKNSINEPRYYPL